MYKYEMHLHTTVSKCGRVTPKEVVQGYYDAGYDGIFITDHFIHGNTSVDKTLPWEERMRLHFEPYEEAKRLADELGISLFIGLEHHYKCCKELLVYGDISLNDFISRPDVNDMQVGEFAEFCHSKGWLVVHAHPFRERQWIDPDFPPFTDGIDGIEVYNHCNNAEENLKATELCEELGLIPVSGSDAHTTDIFGMAGVAFERRIKTAEELISALKNGEGRLIVGGEIV